MALKAGRTGTALDWQENTRRLKPTLQAEARATQVREYAHGDAVEIFAGWFL
jgi:hypothetical protein